MRELAPGDVMWANLDPTLGREQGGRRPVVIVASALYLNIVDSMAIVVPVSNRDRGWPNHIRLTGATGLGEASWALTEQPRTISRTRLDATAGTIDNACLEAIRLYLRDFMDF